MTPIRKRKNWSEKKEKETFQAQFILKGARILFYHKINSTNLKAKEIAKNNLSGWTIILADSQNKGYGKGKRFWFSPSGGLYFSLILPKISLRNLRLLTFITAVALVKTIRKITSLGAVIKWPNDILIVQDGVSFKKIAGILVENIIGKKSRISIVGIGINTNIKNFPRYLSSKATSVVRETGKEVNNRSFLNSFLEFFKDSLKKSNEEIVEEYKRYEILIGRSVKATIQKKIISARVWDFDKEGAIMIKLKGGQIIKVLEGSLEIS